MSVALLIPEFLSGMSFRQQPLGMLYAATYLDKYGISNDVIDMRAYHYQLNYLLKMLEKYDVIFVTTTPYDQVQTYYVDYRLTYSLYLINTIKRLMPKKTLVVCGSHGTVRPDLIMKQCMADIIIKGEYDCKIAKIAHHLLNHIEISNISNLCIRSRDNYFETEVNDNDRFENFKDDIFPAYNKIDMTRYFGDAYFQNIPYRKVSWGAIQASRGCSCSCTFCYKFWGQKIRKRCPESVVSEIQLLNSKYHIENLFFIDYTFTYYKEWVLEICEIILKKNIKINWTIETRIDKLDKEIVYSLSKAGCKNIWLGIESFDEKILNINKKNYSPEIIPEVITLLKNYNIDPHVFVMLGLPGETVESLNKMIQMIYVHKLPYTKSIITATPRYGTDYYDMAVVEYPEISEDWNKLNDIKGLVNNSVDESILMKAKSILANRDFINDSFCPQI